MKKLLQIASCFVGLVLLGEGESRAADTRQVESPQLVVQTGHADGLTSVAYSPDGAIVVTGSSDKTLKLWDVASGRELRTLAGHTKRVTSVAFSPDGRSVVSGSDDRTLKVWDVSTGRERITLVGHEYPVDSIAFSPDGEHIICGGILRFSIFSLTAGELLRTLPVKANGVAFSPNGKIAAFGSDGNTVKLWDMEKGMELSTLTGHTNSVNSVAFSPKGRTMVSGSDDKTIKLWDVATGLELRTIKVPEDYEEVAVVAFSPDGKTVISGGTTLRLWDVKTGKQLRAIPVLSHSLAVSSDGKSVATGGQSGLTVWDMATGQQQRVIDGYGNSVSNIEFSADGKSFGFIGGGSARLLDLTTGQVSLVVKRHESNEQDIALSMERRASIAKVVKHPNEGIGLEQLGVDLKLRELPAGEPRTLDQNLNNVEEAVFSPDGKTVAVVANPVTGRSILKLLNVTTNSILHTFEGSLNIVHHVAFSQSGDLVIVVSFEPALSQKEARSRMRSCGFVEECIDFYRSVKTSESGIHGAALRLLKVDTGEELRNIQVHAGGIWKLPSAAISPDGKTVASGSDGALRQWELSTGNELRTFDSHVDKVDSVVFSNDGKMLALGSGQSISLWDVATGRKLHTLLGHSDIVHSITFSPDGKMIASGGKDRNIKFWRTTDGAHLATLYTFTDGSWVVTDPEGRFDTADLEEIKGLHWVMPDDPLTPVPLGVFMKDYYEPRLLPRILNGEKFKPVRALMDLNRVQPQVKIVRVTQDKA